MNKKEYLKNLKENLSSLPEEDSKKHVRTYRVKINTLINTGLTEEEALKKLGTPQKVANSIIKGKDKKKTTKKKTSTKKHSVSKTSNSKTKKEKKETLVQKKDRMKKLLDEKKEELKASKKEKKEDKKKEDLEDKKTKKVKEKKTKKSIDIIEEKEELKDSLDDKKIVNVEVEPVVKEEEVVTENIDTIKPINVILKQITNLICLLIVLAIVHYPFNLLNIYAIKTIYNLGLDMIFVYAFSVLVYLFYLVFCIVSVCYYLKHITDNKKVRHFNVVSQKVKRISLYLLVVPSMLLVIALTMLFIMSCFFYLDGLRVKGLPIVCFGLLTFACILYTTLRNKILRKEKSIFYSFFTYIIPLVIVGVGLGSVYHDTNNYELVLDVTNKYSMKTVEFEYELPEAEDFRIYFNTNYSTAPIFKEDKKLKDKVRIEITYYKDYYELNNSYDSTSTYISLGAGYRRKISMFLENIQDNKIYSLNELERYEVIIYTNSKDAKRVVVES